MFGTNTALRPAKAPLRHPIRPVRRPVLYAPSDTPDPRYPCMRCGTRPSEIIVGDYLADGARWLCRFCWARHD